MTHEEYDHDRDLEEARFSWYLGLLVLAFFIFMECVFTYRAARFGHNVEVLFMQILAGVLFAIQLTVLIKGRKRLFNGS